MRLDLTLPVVLIALAETLVWAAMFYLFPILLLRWEAEFGWGRAEIALALTLALTISALASPFAGRLIDQGFSRLMFPGAALLGAAMLLLLSFADSKPVFFFAWAMIGLACSACLYEPCFAFLTRTKGVGARGAITTTTLVAGFASTLCFPLADWIASEWGWRVAAQVFAGLAVCAAILFAIAISTLEGAKTPRPTSAARDASKAAARHAMGRPVFWLLAGAFPILALAHSMTISHLMPILNDRGASPNAAVLAASLIGPCQVAGRIVITMVAADRSPAAITQIAFAAVIASMGLFFLAERQAMIFAAVVLFGAGYGVLSITRPLVAADFLGRAGFGAISGALALPYIACAAAAPTLAALLWRFGGYDLVIALGAGLAATAMGLLWMAARASQRAPIDPASPPR